MKHPDGGMRTFLWFALALLAVRLALMAFVPVFEPSEARYAAISANMARSGDFVIPRFTHDLEYQSFDGKPPLVFQAGGLFCRALGTGSPVALQFAVRIFPFLSALLVLLILYHAVSRTHGSDAGRLAVAVCATATAFYAAAGIAMTDMSLTCCVAGALLLYGCYADTRRLRYCFGVAALLGAGMIVKGPVALVMFGLPVLLDAIVNRRWSRIFTGHWLAVAPVFFAVAVPWFVLAEQRNPGATWYFFYNENFLRFVSHDYGDKYGAGREAFRGVSVLWAFVATLPWALVPVGRIAAAAKKGGRAGIRAAVKSVAWRDFHWLAILAIVGFWCLTSRVLLYYLFPMVPLAAAYLATRDYAPLLRRLAPWCALVTLVVAVGGLGGGAFCSEKMQGPKTKLHPLENHYAYEFYHGTPKGAEVDKLRAQRDEFLRRLDAWKAKQAQSGRQSGEVSK